VKATSRPSGAAVGSVSVPEKVRRLVFAGTGEPAGRRPATPMAPTTTPASSKARPRHFRSIDIGPRDASARVGRLLTAIDPLAVLRSNARSRADWKRSSGRFSRQWAMMGASPGAAAVTVGGSSGTSSRRIAVIVSAAVSRFQARVPVAIS
jgi:hypothetical protein